MTSAWMSGLGLVAKPKKEGLTQPHDPGRSGGTCIHRNRPSEGVKGSMFAVS